MQELENHGDAQYTASIEVGEQSVRAIMDTGSFDILVFSKTCGSCGRAAMYNQSKSRFSRRGALTSNQLYGSGDVSSSAVYDRVAFGTLPHINQSVWEVQSASMPILSNAAFHAIVGVGPPETPQADAWESALGDIKDVLSFLEEGKRPLRTMMKKAFESVRVAREVSKNKAMLPSMAVKTFSICFGNQPGSSGFFIWNDNAAIRDPGVFSSVSVVGKHTWSVQLTNVQLDAADGFSTLDLGYLEGAGALIDSGTSLLGVPTPVFQELNRATMKLNSDCSNAHELPNFAFKLGGTKFVLPPSSYVAKVFGEVPQNLQSLVRLRHPKVKHYNETQAAACQLLVMEMNAASSFGVSFVLGVPFLRQYYTTFNIGSHKEDRNLQVAYSGGACEPLAKKSEDSKAAALFLHHVDASKLYVPHRVLLAAQSGRIRL